MENTFILTQRIGRDHSDAFLLLISFDILIYVWALILYQLTSG